MGCRGSEWNAKAIDRLRELAAEGLSSEAIGAKLGKTKNAIIGACRRRGIPLLYRQYDAIPARSYDLLELRAGMCRWPEGTRAPYRFCGMPQAEGGAYCAAHASIAYQRPGARVAA